MTPAVRASLKPDESEALLEHARWICADYIARAESANQRIAVTLGVAVTLGTAIIALGMSEAASGWLKGAYLVCGVAFAWPTTVALRALKPIDGNDVSHDEIARVQKHMSEWPDADLSAALLGTLIATPRGDSGHPAVIDRLGELKDRRFDQYQATVRALIFAASACPLILGISYTIAGVTA